MPRIKLHQCPKPMIEYYNKRIIDNATFGVNIRPSTGEEIYWAKSPKGKIAHRWRYVRPNGWTLVEATGDFDFTNEELNSGWRSG
jgi:hypothetical protein